MSLCMGMAQSTPQGKASATTNGHKGSLITRLRKKLNLPGYHSSKSNNAAAKANATVPTMPAANEASTLESGTKRPDRRSVIPHLPRTQTLMRTLSEKREKLKPSLQPVRPVNERPPPHKKVPYERTGGRISTRSLQPIPSHSIASLKETQQQEAAARPSSEPIPTVPEDPKSADSEPPGGSGELVSRPNSPRSAQPPEPHGSAARLSNASKGIPSPGDNDDSSSFDRLGPRVVSREIEEEMEWRWILNLSMHFRDESSREKFFVTYAQERNIRRRLTISLDYRDASEGSLEKELTKLKFQRDKSAKIYDAIRESLPDIMFYETITNLKLQTTNGRLHVHVTEDVNEIIHFPPVMAIAHLRCPKYRERDLEFDSHLSGFVYKVLVDGQIMIKKEIPGPDTVDEFLYEINALYSLADSDNVIQFGGCVVDDRREKVKGLLISFAPKGALIDILFNERGKLSWALREKWAKQIVSGLSEIHEAGYVQGDFTLSNMVIDEHDNCKIIDINRRGCPVGWEPPEVTGMIDGLQRIGMYIGVKSDLFQLGMVLWGIAHETDEPEAVPRPLTMDQAPDDVPAYFRRIVEACLCDKPQGRPSAKEIIGMFPNHVDEAPQIIEPRDHEGRPLPGIRQWTNGHVTDSPTHSARVGSARSVPLSGENLEALESLSPKRPPSPTEPPPPSATESTLPEVIDAEPSEFSEDDDDTTRHMISSISSSIGGGGVRLPTALSDSHYSNATYTQSLRIPPPGLAKEETANTIRDLRKSESPPIIGTPGDTATERSFLDAKEEQTDAEEEGVEVEVETDIDRTPRKGL